jgi:hypothetical protein
MTKTIYKKQWTSPVAWGVEGTPKVEGYIEYKVHFSFKEGICFSISIPNFGCGSRNPFECIFRALEHSSVGMGKYCRLKERTRSLGMWKNL